MTEGRIAENGTRKPHRNKRARSKLGHLALNPEHAVSKMNEYEIPRFETFIHGLINNHERTSATNIISV